MTEVDSKAVHAPWVWLDVLRLKREDDELSNREIGERIRGKYHLKKGFDPETVSRILNHLLPDSVLQMPRYVAEYHSILQQHASRKGRRSVLIRLLDGHWDFDEKTLSPDYRLGEEKTIVRDELAAGALVQALEEISLGVSRAAAGRAYGFAPEYLRSVTDDPYFHYGFVKMPLLLLNELENAGRVSGKRYRSNEPGYVWVRGKHPATISEDLISCVKGRPGWNFGLLTRKIELLFKGRVEEELTLQQMASRFHLPWQTIADYLRNKKCVAIVGQERWEAAQRVKPWRMLKVGERNRSAILREIASAPKTTHAVTVATGIDLSTVTHRLADLSREGYAKRTRGSDRFFVYEITDRGKSRLANSAPTQLVV